MTAARTFEYRGSAPVFAWYSLRDDDTFVCRCGWRGSFAQMVQETYEELIDGSCPQCDTMLLIRSHPTEAQIRAAAADGDREAVDQLRSIERVRRGET